MQQFPRQMGRNAALIDAICARPTGERVLLAGTPAYMAEIAAQVRARRPDLVIVFSTGELRGQYK